MKSIFILLLLIMSNQLTRAQQFIEKGTIEYEVKTNVYKTMGSGRWADMFKDNMPKFKTGYYNLVFDKGNSAFLFDHWEANSKMPDYMKKTDENNSWYFDHAADKYYMKKDIYGSVFYVEDTMPHINWKLGDEIQVIAGYNCRKATGIILDSVYVFAFYTEEIVIPGGPCSISGLPGTILGLTIPRLYTSWIATKITQGVADEKILKPFTAKKSYTRSELLKTVKERTSDWGFSDEEEDGINHRDMLLWNIML